MLVKTGHDAAGNSAICDSNSHPRLHWRDLAKIEGRGISRSIDKLIGREMPTHPDVERGFTFSITIHGQTVYFSSFYDTIYKGTIRLTYQHTRYRHE
jgi:hypothetical protein